jgi:hypothetical protein
MRSWHGTRSLQGQALAMLLLMATIAGASEVGPDVLLPVDEQDLLVLEVRADRYLASEGILGYRHEDEVLLPLGELAAALEYAVIAYPDRGVVEGWIVEDDRTFRLDVGARSVTVEGRQRGLEAPCVHVNDHDIYVSSDVLSDWWPVDFEIDLRRLRVEVVPREQVPLISRLQREREWEQLAERQARAKSQYPRRRAAYRLASWPFLDASLSLVASDDAREAWGSVLARGDVAQLSTMGFLGIDSRRNESMYSWLRAGRTDRDGQLLGPFHATSFAFGDVTATALPFAGGAQRGRGFMVSNRRLGSTAQFDAIDITGDAPPGWEVELYTGGTLHAIQVATAEGYYRFDDVPLHTGVNRIRTVLYGPSGQTREEVRTYNIRGSMQPTGSLQYDVSSVQAQRSLFGQQAADRTGSGDWHHQFSLGYGVGPSTTVGAALTHVDGDSTSRRRVVGQVLQSLGPVFLQAVTAKDLNSGVAGRVALQSRLGNRSLLVNYERFRDFENLSDASKTRDSRRFSARLRGILGDQQRIPWTYRLELSVADDLEQERGRSQRYGAYLGGELASLNVGTALMHDRRQTGAPTTVGQTFLAGYLKRLRLNGQLAYELDAPELQSISGSMSYPFPNGLRIAFQGTHMLADGGNTSVSGQVDWDLRPVRLGLRGSVSEDRWQVGVTASSSLMLSSRPRDWVMSGRRLTNRGGALVRTFIDQNANGAFDRDDQPLGGVEFRGRRLWEGIRTADDGKAMLPGLPANQFVNVELDYGSVRDPYLVPMHEALTTLVHAGGVSDLEFPFRYVGEVEGVVARDEALQQRLRSVGLELIDPSGERQASTVSEFDGYYLFQDVPPGDYRLRVVEETLRGRPFLIPAPAPVTVPPSGGFVPGPDVVLKPAAPAETRVASAEEPAAPASAPGEPPREDPPAEQRTDVSSETVASAESPGQPVREVVAEAAGEDGNAAPAAAPPAEQASTAEATATPDAAATTEPAAEVAPRDLRSLNLIYEMLYHSQLFAGDER